MWLKNVIRASAVSFVLKPGRVLIEVLAVVNVRCVSATAASVVVLIAKGRSEYIVVAVRCCVYVQNHRGFEIAVQTAQAGQEDFCSIGVIAPPHVREKGFGG